MIVGKTLESCVFCVGQSPVSVTDFISLIMSTMRCSESWRNTIGSKYSVAHSRATALIVQNANPINQTVNKHTIPDPFPRRVVHKKL